MKLTDIMPLEGWIELEKDIHELSGLASNVFDSQGIRISDYKVWVNRLCPVVKADKKGQSFICAVANMNIAGQARKARRPVIDECDAGLVKLVVPIFVRDEFLGAASACGLLLDSGEVDAFMIDRTLGLEEDEVADLSSDIKRMTTAEAQALCEAIEERIERIRRGFENRS